LLTSRRSAFSWHEAYLALLDVAVAPNHTMQSEYGQTKLPFKEF